MGARPPKNQTHNTRYPLSQRRLSVVPAYEQMSLGGAVGICSDGRVSHIRMTLPRYGGCVKKA